MDDGVRNVDVVDWVRQKDSSSTYLLYFLLRKMQTSTLNTCFVISPFGAPFDTYFTHVIKPAVESCGLYAMRGDSLYRPTTIVDDIWKGIQDSKLLVAELTGRNPNVFYELGLAHAISKPVILLSESIEDVPFDLRAIRVLLYDKSHPEWGTQLRQNLTKAIHEVLSNPNTAIPTTFKFPVTLNRPEESETLLRIDALEAAVQRISEWTIDLQPAVSPEEESADADASSILGVGQTVFHQRFGMGNVLQIIGQGDDARVQVNFENSGLKWLDPNIARMRVISYREKG